MILGDPNNFAIEVEIDPNLVAPSAVWGRMCIHINRLVLGDFSEGGCALYPAYRHFEFLSWETAPLWDHAFKRLTLEEIHDIVRDTLYGDDKGSPAATQYSTLRFRQFDFLTNWGEQFDGYASVIIQPTWDTVTVLHRPHSDLPQRRLPGEFVTAACTHDGFVDACNKFVEWFDMESKRLS
jgi:hypothetical protein